jgi:hypothetical protein
MSRMPRRPRPRRVHFCLPPLAPHEALQLVSILERITHAIWEAHGPQMNALLAALPLSEPHPADGAADAADLDLPF